MQDAPGACNETLLVHFKNRRKKRRKLRAIFGDRMWEDSRHVDSRVRDLPQRAADESGTSSLTAMFTGGRSVVRTLVARSRRPPAHPFTANQRRSTMTASFIASYVTLSSNNVGQGLYITSFFPISRSLRHQSLQLAKSPPDHGPRLPGQRLSIQTHNNSVNLLRAFTNTLRN